MFQIGQKVVCVDDSTTDAAGRASLQSRGMIWPSKGLVYVVRWVGHWHFNDGPLLAVRVAEIINPVVTWADGDADELAFLASRFRPLIERKTDISIFTEILDTERRKVPEKV
jgi:hypothetical protein